MMRVSGRHANRLFRLYKLVILRFRRRTSGRIERAADITLQAPSASLMRSSAPSRPEVLACARMTNLYRCFYCIICIAVSETKGRGIDVALPRPVPHPPKWVAMREAAVAITLFWPSMSSFEPVK